MANGETRSNPNTHFRLVESGKKRCISFNNTYSLMVRGNSVSFVNVSCEKGGKNVWFKFERLGNHSDSHHGFSIRNRTMCLTSSRNGTLSVVKVNPTVEVDRNCFFKREIIR
ncbi:unnamed protein product [Porites lobata]|uniref:Uncharacterized protein n=1 Tax=Porites lobata TaxID=104759 RepID=A0ABN8RZ68_9CNID|nr:unnamed protein product [Porites lobata]